MRILLLTSSDICSCINLNLLLKGLAENHEIFVMSSIYEFPGERANPIAREKFYLEKDYVRDEFFVQLDARKDPKNEEKYLSFKALEKKYGIEILEIPREKPQQFILEYSQKVAPDIIFCCRFEYILKEAMIALPKLGAYNMHSGLLPECAGPDSTFWAMHNDWDYSGCTVHKINISVDQGDIFARETFALNYKKGVIWNRIEAYKLGIQAFFNLVEKIMQEEKIEYLTQDLKTHAFFPFPNEEELLELYTEDFLRIEKESFKEIINNFLTS